MANTYKTAADILLMNDKNNDFNVDNVVSATPFVQLLPARLASHGTRETYLRTTGYPSTVIHGINDGKDYTASTEDQVNVDLKYFDASVLGPVAAAKVFGDETSYILDQAGKALKGMFLKLENSVINGTFGDANSPEGFADLIPYLNSPMAVDGGGSGEGNIYSSVYLVKYTGNEGAFLTLKGPAEIGDPYKTVIPGENGKSMAAVGSDISAWAAGALKSTYAVSRIANLTAADSLTDALIAEAVAKHPNGFKPDVIVMNRAQRAKLQQSRITALLPTAATPTESDGIPIVISEVITNTEAALVND